MRLEWCIFQILICSIIITPAYSAPHTLILLLLINCFWHLYIHLCIDRWHKLTLSSSQHSVVSIVTKLQAGRSGLKFQVVARHFSVLENTQTSSVLLHAFSVCTEKNLPLPSTLPSTNLNPGGTWSYQVHSSLHSMHFYLFSFEY